MNSFKQKKGKTGKTGNYEFGDELTKTIKIIYSNKFFKKGKTGNFEFRDDLTNKNGIELFGTYEFI